MAEAVLGYVAGDYFIPITEGSWERMYCLRTLMPEVGERATDVLPIEVTNNQAFPICLTN